jgi:hypothetical protein
MQRRCLQSKARLRPPERLRDRHFAPQNRRSPSPAFLRRLRQGARRRLPAETRRHSPAPRHRSHARTAASRRNSPGSGHVAAVGVQRHPCISPLRVLTCAGRGETDPRKDGRPGGSHRAVPGTLQLTC